MNARAGSFTLSRPIYGRRLVSMQQCNVYNVVVIASHFFAKPAIVFCTFAGATVAAAAGLFIPFGAMMRTKDGGNDEVRRLERDW